MELRLKEEIFGFAWNFETGEIGEVFTEELSSREIELMAKVIGEDVCLVLNDSDIELVFGEDIGNQDELEEMELAGVMEFV